MPNGNNLCCLISSISHLSWHRLSLVKAYWISCKPLAPGQRAPCREGRLPRLRPRRGLRFCSSFVTFAKALHRNQPCSRLSDTRCSQTPSRALSRALRWQQTSKEQLIQLADGKVSSRHFFWPRNLSDINANILSGFHQAHFPKGSTAAGAVPWSCAVPLRVRRL